MSGEGAAAAMNFSVVLPNHLLAGTVNSEPALVVLARAAEAAGFAGVCVTDHPCPTGRWLDRGGHTAPDPFTALGFIAGATSRVLLHTSILVMPYRNPFITARAGSSLDVFSGGRLILGVGVGYLKGEYKALGADFDRRNELTDEYLTALTAAWTEDEFAFEGTGYSARGNRILPRPIQQPHPPIWVGGNSRRAIRRAVRYGDAWCPFHLPAESPVAQTARTAAMGGSDALRSGIAYLRECVDELGRERPIRIALDSFTSAPDADTFDALAGLSELGVSWVTVHVSGSTVSQWCDGAQRFAEDIIAHFRREAGAVSGRET